MREFTFYDGSIRVVNPEGAEYEVKLTRTSGRLRPTQPRSCRRKGFYSDLPCVTFTNGHRSFTYDLFILLCHSGDLGFDGAEPSQWISMENLNDVFSWAEKTIEPPVLKACFDAADEWEAGP